MAESVKKHIRFVGLFHVGGKELSLLRFFFFFSSKRLGISYIL